GPLMASGWKIGSVGLAGSLMPDPAELIDGQFHARVAQQRVGQALPADLAQLQGGGDQCLVGILLLGDDVTVGSNHHRAAPEIGSILVADPVAVEKEGCQKLRVSPADQVVRLCRAQPLVGGDPSTRARRRTDDQVDAFQAEYVGAGEVPDVFADQDPGPAKRRLKAAEPV